MGEGLARAITIGSIVLTVASLGLAVVFARKKTRIRIGFDLTRAIVGIGAILVMAAVTNVTTSTLAVLLAVAGGLALGFTQGSSLEISTGERGFYARRSPIALVGWGAGIIVMQAAGIASRSGAVRLGQTIAWFSACLGIGLLVGRTGPLNRSFARTGVATIVIAVALPTAVFITGTETQAAAQTIQLTDEEMCDLTPRDGSWSRGLDSGEMSFNHYVGETDEFVFVNVSAPGATAACANRLEEGHFDGTWFRVAVYQLPSAEQALAAENSLLEYFGSYAVLGVLPGAGAAGADAYSADFVYNRLAVARVGSFLVVGRTDGYDNWEDYDLILAERMAEAMTNIEALSPVVAPPPDDASPPDEDTGVPPPGDATPTDDVAGVPPVEESAAAPAGEDEPIEPEEAAAQAIAGLVAAAAIGLITWAEAASGIGQILDGLGGGGTTGGAPVPKPLPTGPQGPFIDPYDQTELEVDPETGMVFWPWDGRGGHDVHPSEVPALIDEWNRELDAETARRVALHDAQRAQNRSDLHDRIRRSELEDAARQAEEQARFDAFDRRVEAARTWMEEADADSLDQLDRIMQRAANQGYATDADIERAGRIADRARVWASTRQQWDAEDWTRITNNRNTVLEVTAKGVSIMIDPTRGWVSGAIWGGIESYDRGDDMATVIGNSALNATIFRGTHAIGTWAPGRAAVGRIGWGSIGGSVSAGGETLLRGGSLEDAWHASQIGFVAGGMGGIAEEAATIGARPPARVPTIRTTRGGPRVGYDTPLRPSLRPPERGGIGSMPESVPVIRVEPGGPRVGYDDPIDPHHIDPGDPRYEPWNPAHQPPRPPPRILPEEGPLGGRPPSQPPQVSPVDALDRPPPIDVPDQPRPVDVPDRPPPTGVPVRVPPSPPRLIPEEGVHGGRTPAKPPQVAPLDVFDRPPPIDVPEAPPPVDVPEAPPPVDVPDRPPPVDVPERVPPLTPAQALEGARPARPTPDILDDMMNQPHHPAGTNGPGGVQEWQPGNFPDADGRTMIDPDGRVVVNDRHIGNVEPESGTLVNLDNEPMTVALDHRGVPAGYIEQPGAPPGMNPTYNGRGELVGYVDDLGRADIGGELVPVAIDHQGNLVPYDAPRSTSPPVEHLPPEGLRGQSRLGGADVEPTTGALTEPLAASAGDVPPPTGHIEASPPGDAGTPVDYTPYGQPVSAGDGQPPAALSDLDRGARIPVLDDSGGVAHLVEPGPREIHYDANGTPHFVQRQHPVQSTPMGDIDLGTMRSFPGARQMPTPEVFDATEAWHPLAGDGAPPAAPDVIRPTPPGGDPP